MPQTSAAVTSGNDAKATDFNKAVADLAEIYAGGPGVPIGGVIWLWSNNTIPSNYLEANGQTVSDGASPLNGLALPTLTNRFVRGVSNQNLRGGDIVGGEDQHTLSWDEMPVHSHGVNDPGHTHRIAAFGTSGTYGLVDSQHASSSGANVQTGGSGTGIWLGNAGSGWAHNNIPVYIGLVPIIRYK